MNVNVLGSTLHETVIRLAGTEFGRDGMMAFSRVTEGLGLDVDLGAAFFGRVVNASYKFLCVKEEIHELIVMRTFGPEEFPFVFVNDDIVKVHGDIAVFVNPYVTENFVIRNFRTDVTVVIFVTGEFITLVIRFVCPEDVFIGVVENIDRVLAYIGDGNAVHCAGKGDFNFEGVFADFGGKTVDFTVRTEFDSRRQFAADDFELDLVGVIHVIGHDQLRVRNVLDSVCHDRSGNLRVCRNTGEFNTIFFTRIAGRTAAVLCTGITDYKSTGNRAVSRIACVIKIRAETNLTDVLKFAITYVVSVDITLVVCCLERSERGTFGDRPVFVERNVLSVFQTDIHTVESFRAEVSKEDIVVVAEIFKQEDFTLVNLFSVHGDVTGFIVHTVDEELGSVFFGLLCQIGYPVVLEVSTVFGSSGILSDRTGFELSRSFAAGLQRTAGCVMRSIHINHITGIERRINGSAFFERDFVFVFILIHNEDCLITVVVITVRVIRHNVGIQRMSITVFILDKGVFRPEISIRGKRSGCRRKFFDFRIFNGSERELINVVLYCQNGECHIAFTEISFVTASGLTCVCKQLILNILKSSIENRFFRIEIPEYRFLNIIDPVIAVVRSVARVIHRHGNIIGAGSRIRGIHFKLADFPSVFIHIIRIVGSSGSIIAVFFIRIQILCHAEIHRCPGQRNIERKDFNNLTVFRKDCGERFVVGFGSLHQTTAFLCEICLIQKGSGDLNSIGRDLILRLIETFVEFYRYSGLHKVLVQSNTNDELFVFRPAVFINNRVETAVRISFVVVIAIGIIEMRVYLLHFAAVTRNYRSAQKIRSTLDINIKNIAGIARFKLIELTNNHFNIFVVGIPAFIVGISVREIDRVGFIEKIIFIGSI